MILIPICLYKPSFIVFCVKFSLTFLHKNKLFDVFFILLKEYLGIKRFIFPEQFDLHQNMTKQAPT